MNEFRFFLKWVNLSVYLFASNLLLILGGLQGSFFRYATSRHGPARRGTNWGTHSQKKSVSLRNLCSGSLAFLLPAWICLATLMHRSRSERDTWTSYTIEFIAVTSSIFFSTILYPCAAQHKCIYLSQKCRTWTVQAQTDVFQCSRRLSRGRYTSLSAACGYKHRAALQKINPDVAVVPGILAPLELAALKWCVFHYIIILIAVMSSPTCSHINMSKQPLHPPFILSVCLLTQLAVYDQT